MAENKVSIYQAFLNEGIDLKSFDFGRYIDFGDNWDEENPFDFAKVDWENLALSGVNYKVLMLGNPGVGKSATTELLAKTLGLPIVDTDVWFRSERAKSETESPVTKEFFDWIRKEKILAWNPEHKGEPTEVTLALTKDSKACRKAEFGRIVDGKWVAIPAKEGWAGEEVFRKYEELLLKYGFENGKFKDSMLATSSTAPTRQANVDNIKANDYQFLLLNPEKQDVYAHLFDDWQAFRKDGKSRRGAYEEVADKGFEQGLKQVEKIGRIAPYLSNEFAEGCAYGGLANYWDKVYAERMPKLGQLLKNKGGVTVQPKSEASKAEVAAICLGAMVYLNQR